LKALADLGYLDDTERSDTSGKTYAEFTGMLIGADGKNVREAAAKYLNMPFGSEILDRIQWLGLFDDKKLPSDKYSSLDYLTNIMLERMPYKEGEKDMIVLFHDFHAELSDGKREHITSTLIDFGIPHGDSSMSRTVSLPAAVATRMILEGKIDMKGVHIPVAPEIYNPVLDELETMNIKCKEETK
jgi:saccharopine dehydrogenase-like NADP-dependent oxidoreductase